MRARGRGRRRRRGRGGYEREREDGGRWGGERAQGLTVCALDIPDALDESGVGGEERVGGGEHVRGAHGGFDDNDDVTPVSHERYCRPSRLKSAVSQPSILRVEQ